MSRGTVETFYVLQDTSAKPSRNHLLSYKKTVNKW